MRGNWFKTVFGYTMSALKVPFRWIKRTLYGTKKELDGLEGKEVESPSRLFREAFFSKKTTLGALLLLLALFLFVLIAPTFVSLDVNYTDPLQQNVAPGYSLRAIPRKLKKSMQDVNGFSDFTVGLSQSGEVFVWGNTKDKLNKNDLKKIPSTVKEKGAVAVAAGKDHIIAVTKDGQIVGWGDKSCGQYGTEEVLNAIVMPSSIAMGVAPDEVRGLSCGYQATALVLEDGSCYVWGNTNSVKNLMALQNMQDVFDVAFTNSVAVALKKDGSIFMGNEAYFHAAVSSKNGRQNSFNAYMVGKKAVKIAANNKCIAVLTGNGELILPILII